jgi:hypothetical protein
MAVVKGGTGTCCSSLAPRPRVQPSGVLRTTGGFDATDPSSDAVGAAAGSVSGSAPAVGAMSPDMTRHTTTRARRTTTAIGLTGNTVRTGRYEPGNLLSGQPELLCVCNCYAIWTKGKIANSRLFGRTRRAAMTLRTWARGLLAGAATAMVLASGTGLAHADPNPSPPPVPPENGQWVQFPQTFLNPDNESQPTNDTGDVGMVCENLLVPCR